MDENEIDRIIVGAAVMKEGITRSVNGLDEGRQFLGALGVLARE